MLHGVQAVKDRHEAQQLLAYAASILHRSRLRSWLQGWQALADTAAWQRERIAGCLARLQKGSLAACWNTWLAHMQEGRNTHAVRRLIS